MRITKKWLEDRSVYKKNIPLYEKYNETGSMKLLELLITDKRFLLANWLIVQLMSRKQYLKYAVYAAEQIESVYNTIYIRDNSFQRAIASAKQCIKRDSIFNQEIAANAVTAVNRICNMHAKSRNIPEPSTLGTYAASVAFFIAKAASNEGIRKPIAYSVAKTVSDKNCREAVVYAVAYASSVIFDEELGAKEKTGMLKVINYGMELLTNEVYHSRWLETFGLKNK